MEPTYYRDQWLDVMFQDAGQYKCRVDYHLQQTSFQLLELSVIVPPSPPLILHNNQPGISPGKIGKPCNEILIAVDQIFNDK